MMATLSIRDSIQCDCNYSFLNTRALSAIAVLIFHRNLFRRNLMHRTFRAAVWNCEVAHDESAQTRSTDRAAQCLRARSPSACA